MTINCSSPLASLRDNKIASLGLGAPLLRPSCDLGWTSRGFSKHNTKMDNRLTLTVPMLSINVC